MRWVLAVAALIASLSLAAIAFVLVVDQQHRYDAYEECVGTAWQSLQSWEELSRTSRLPSPFVAETTTPTGAE